MGNVLLGFPIYSDISVSYTPALSEGSWSVDAPLTNLQERTLTNVARSADALAASTLFNVDLGVARAVGVLALPAHNLTGAATVQWKAGTAAGLADIYDSTALAMSFAAVSDEDRDGLNLAHVHVPAATVTARYWRCEIVDTGNPAGYVDLGRLVIAGAFSPTFNMKRGAKLGLEDESTRSVTDGGAAKYDAKPVRRTTAFLLDHLSQTEAFANAWAIQRRAGKTKQLLFVFNKSDTTLMHERSFLGVLRELSALEFPYAIPEHAMAFALIEEL